MRPSSRRERSNGRLREPLERVAPSGMVTRLGVQVDRGPEAGPEVRLLLDGQDPLGSGGFSTGNHPRELLGTGALLPTDRLGVVSRSGVCPRDKRVADPVGRCRCRCRCRCRHEEEVV